MQCDPRAKIFRPDRLGRDDAGEAVGSSHEVQPELRHIGCG